MTKKTTFPIEAGSIKLFARACGDHSDKYNQDDCYAPPTYVQSVAQYEPDYFLRPHPNKEWFGSGKNPTSITKSSSGSSGSNAGTLHAEQKYEFTRPVQAGEKLFATTSPGKTWKKQGKKGGELLFTQSIVEFRDAEGKLVVTATSVGVVTEKIIE